MFLLTLRAVPWGSVNDLGDVNSKLIFLNDGNNFGYLYDILINLKQVLHY